MTQVNIFTSIVIDNIDEDDESVNKLMDIANSYKDGEYDLEDTQVKLSEWVHSRSSLGEKSEADFNLVDHLLYYGLMQVDWEIVANYVIENYGYIPEEELD